MASKPRTRNNKEGNATKTPSRGSRPSELAPHQPAEAQAARWILLMPNIPATPTSVRVRVWRRLQSVGAVALKNGVYVLPARDECVETFQWIARELAELGGQASLCEGRFFDDGTDDEIERRFIEASNTSYAALADDTREVTASLKAGKKIDAEKLAELTAQHVKLHKRFEEISAFDFCHAPGRESAEAAVNALGQKLALLRGTSPEEKSLDRCARPVAATWVTRTGVHIDRIACAWLIRRFIDPRATLKFVPAKDYVPEPGELRFDMFEAEFTHVGDRCSFEVLRERMALEDPALEAMGQIVHDIDVRDGKYNRPETGGVQSFVQGICLTQREDAERIATASHLFDALHAALSVRPGTRKSRSGAE